MSSPPADEGALGLLEWWRVLDIDRSRNSHVLFIEERTAEVFARCMVAGHVEQVVVEHWRDGELVDLRMLVGVSRN